MTDAPVSMTLIGYRYHGGQDIHFATRDTVEVSEFLASRIAVGTVAYPANWRDLGSSAKDLWEERQMESIRKKTQRPSVGQEEARP